MHSCVSVTALKACPFLLRKMESIQSVNEWQIVEHSTVQQRLSLENQEELELSWCQKGLGFNLSSATWLRPCFLFEPVSSSGLTACEEVVCFKDLTHGKCLVNVSAFSYTFCLAQMLRRGVEVPPRLLVRPLDHTSLKVLTTETA